MNDLLATGVGVIAFTVVFFTAWAIAIRSPSRGQPKAVSPWAVWMIVWMASVAFHMAEGWLSANVSGLPEGYTLARAASDIGRGTLVAVGVSAMITVVRRRHSTG